MEKEKVISITKKGRTMNKVLKGLVAVAAAAAMAVTGFAGASTAMADPATTTNITISDATQNDEFNAYKLLNLTTSVEGQGADQTTNYSYTVNGKYRSVLTTAINALKSNAVPTATGTTEADQDKAIIDYVTKNVVNNETTTTGDQVTARKFAEKVREQIVTSDSFKGTDGKLDSNKADGHATASEEYAKADNRTKAYKATLSNMAQGYYLIVQTKAAGADGKTMSQVILDTHGQDVTDVTVKKDTVTLTKKVQENQDGVANPAKDNWQDGADYNIGDMVPFQLTGTLPTDYDNYNAYKYVFHDSASNGLTFNANDAELKVYAVNKSGRTELKKAADASDETGYNVTTTGLTGETFQVQFANLKKAQAAETTETVTINKNTTIVVEYKATLNNDAKRGAAGNPNEAWLEFSNDQYNTGEGSPTGNTPHDKVIVFTFDLVVNKYKNQADANHKLNGAGFTLYKATTKDGTYNKVQTGTNAQSQPTYEIFNKDSNVFRFNGLDSGYYKIVESTVPDGFTKADDVVFSVEATYDTDKDDPKLTKLEIKDADGKVISTDTGAKFTLSGISYDGKNSENAQINTDIVNKSGNKLPSTGGMGTVLLYVAGIAVFVLAGATLVMALRRRNA